MLLRHLLMAKDMDNDSRKLETVLVMHGGGSLGADECGVYKALSKHGKKLIVTRHCHSYQSSNHYLCILCSLAY